MEQEQYDGLNLKSAEDTADVYWMGGLDEFWIDSQWAKLWLPAAVPPSSSGDAGGGASGRAPAKSGDTSTMVFLLDDPANVTATTSGTSARSTTVPTITLGELKPKVSTIEGQVTSIDGTEKARYCLLSYHESLRSIRHKIATQGRPDHYYDHEIRSGMPAGTAVIEYRGVGEPGNKGRWWFDGQDADLFVTNVGDETEAFLPVDP